MLGLAMNCEVRRFNRFARKHYFYPDLPKGYQISQFEEPICERGAISVRLENNSVRQVGIKRIHMEEDAGKNLHDSRAQFSLVDLNRAGVPLLEIVSEADLRSPAEAGAYLRAVRQLVRYLGISDGNMEEGSLRCDANISLRPIGTLKFGTRTEIKNLNSFKFVERALEYEVARQTALLKNGKEVVQQTLLFDPGGETTRPMRGKEESSDYRYMPDPDLPPLVIEERWVSEIRSKLPRLPDSQRQLLIDSYGLSPYDAAVLTSERTYVQYFDQVLAICGDAKAACNWITSELFGRLNKSATDFEHCPIKAADLGRLIQLINEETISGKMAKTVFEEMFTSGRAPDEIVKAKGLQQITNDEEILGFVRQAFSANPTQLKDFVGGNMRLQGFFVGQVMKLSGGTANPKKVNEYIRKEAAKAKGS
jgi:aspartyl-tRNA(Asn)/glutamyl-tRNA(Gln) amidotransferase subunit B